MEVKEKIILFIDAHEAHGLYGKKILKKNKHGFIVRNIKKLGEGGVCSNAFVIVLFMYGEEEGLCQLLPDLKEMTNLILCVNSFEIKWFGHYLPTVAIFDINTPKVELFSQIKKHIQGFNNVHEHYRLGNG